MEARGGANKPAGRGLAHNGPGATTIGKSHVELELVAHVPVPEELWVVGREPEADA